MKKSFNRRSVLKGIAGVSLALPTLEIMGEEVLSESNRAKRFCGLYTANGMSIPQAKNKIDDWSWYPAETGRNFKFNQSTKPLERFRNEVTFFGGLGHKNAILSDPHVCSDMWLTGAPFHDPKPGQYNTVSLDQVIARNTKQYCRQASLVLSIDNGVGFLSRTGTIAYNNEGKPIPAENNPRDVFNRLFLGSKDSMEQQRALLKKKMKIVDAVLDSSRDFNKRLGSADREKMDQYLTSLSELESRFETSEKWIDIPLKKQDYSHLNFDYDLEQDPAQFYQTMFDVITLAFDADITRSVAFMLNREDGMGISNTFPVRLGLSKDHHGLSHAKDKKGQMDFAKYDQFLSGQVAYFLDKLKKTKEGNSNLLDNSLVLFGSGCSTTHNVKNVPTLLAGGKNMGVKHGSYFRRDGEQLSNLYLSILHSMGIKEESFSDSTKPLEEGIFTFKNA
ncbi:DUF1552 domain-containing protein [Lentisphaera marina]|uniref:DUF1552 domain-containing protein n=1 Tax=Lentisphaera marina TaxID=1111041 RepID=UPI002365CE33|nr:DUF1552 domain-containing protein [Lentisphaera marina]MDD7987191.1 DUF1552 domain-containing protein [Lentisphaera marina]